ncbi:MAG: PAS domain-containing protein, partial [Acidobacteriota bacterium]|nr:PAS domain-containing protein [Acidobacteriota bacterium]
MSEAPKSGARGGKRGRRGSRRNGQDFLVVGLGASAGGIKALEQFFARMPSDSGMAFVVVLHLSPEHESNLAGMLQRHTAMKVAQVNEAVRVEPNRVYVIPPAKHMVMEDGRILLAEPDGEAGRRVPIDLLFRTLGAAYREHAVGVVLSGTGSDGTLGLRRIKEEGGISIAQEPQEAEYDGMPRSAIRDGLVDFVLPVADIPEKIIGIRDASQKIKLPPEGGEPPTGEELDALRDILSMMRARTGHDFSSYKQSTILRRVTRRMQMREAADLDAYHQYLREHPAELPELQQDFLISVTNFFRDTAAFDFLGREVVPKLFEGKREDEQVRVWATGCATGEEAYSLAILLAEHAARVGRPPRIQVFATDLDDEAIGQAREGVFPETIAADVSAERLQQFFTHENGYYYVKKQVRETVLFAPHNILRDPPFSRLDLVSCRNLLIYLDRETQARVLEVLHFALRPGGFLFLGSAESADSLPDLFSPFEKKLRVYRRNGFGSALQHIPPMPPGGRWSPRAPADPAPAGLKSYRFAELHRALLEHYAPPSVLVNEAHEVVHVSENAGKYLRVTGGEPTRDLIALIHPDLRLDVRAALYSTSKEMRESTTRTLAVRLDGEARRVRVSVRPRTRPDLHATYLLVTFHEPEEARGPAGD